MCARSSTFILLVAFVLSVLAEKITFKNVKIWYNTEDQQYVTGKINSAYQLKTQSNASRIVRIEIFGGSVQVIHAGDFKGFPALTDLWLSGNELKEIHPGAFSNALDGIRLSRNKITTIQDGVFSNSTIRFLDLDHNLIDSISPHAFDNMTDLRNLNLNHNKIKIVYREWLQDKSKLQMDLGYNQIEHLPSGFFSLTTTTTSSSTITKLRLWHEIFLDLMIWISRFCSWAVTKSKNGRTIL